MLALVLLWVIAIAAQDECYLKATQLKTEDVINPLGIDVTTPRLSWILISSDNHKCRGQYQTAYQIEAASSSELLEDDKPDLWASDVIQSGDTLNILYRGKALTSGQRVYWRVGVWDQAGHHWNTSSEADFGWFEIGLLAETDWTARWIESPYAAPNSTCDFYEKHPAPLLRKEFSIGNGKILRARMYISALGYYELSINGQKVGDHILDQALTTYSETIFYVTYDVTDFLTVDRNHTIGIHLGNGWYNPLPMLMFGAFNLRDALTVGDKPAVRAQLVIRMEDKADDYVIITDSDWKVGEGPIWRNNIYLGEVYYANDEKPGWDKNSYDDSTWQDALVLAIDQVPSGVVRAQYIPPIKMAKSWFKPVRITYPAKNYVVFDLGQNFAGWIQMEVSNATRDQPLLITYGELMMDNGFVNPFTNAAGQIHWGNGGPCVPYVAIESDTYYAKGAPGETEVYRQTFTWHAFQYVQINTSLLYGMPNIDIVGIPVHTDLEQIGQFTCSNQLLNDIQELVLWGIINNMFGIQSDCPGRERFGYGGDALVTLETIMYNFDMSSFDRKRIRDFADASRYIAPSSGVGAMPEIAPYVGIHVDGMGHEAGPIDWGSVFPAMQLALYQLTGDMNMLEEQYDLTTQWIRFLEKNASSNDGFIDNGLGDWAAVEEASVNFTSNVFYLFNLRTTSKIATILGKQDESQKFTEMADLLANKINKRFIMEDGNRTVYGNGVEGAQAFALWHGLTQGNRTASTLLKLEDDIVKNDYHMTAGIFSIQYMLESLSDLGRIDLAYAMINQTTYPSYGYMLANNATSLWECWYWDNNTCSHDHAMFGAVSGWFFEYLGGISRESDAIAYDKIVIAPNVVGDLEWARTSYLTLRGRIEVAWMIQGNSFELNVTVPPNTEATVLIPPILSHDVAKDVDDLNVMEGDVPASTAPAVRHVTGSEYQIGSGSFRFTARGV